MALEVKFHETVNKMVQSLLDHANQKGIALPPVTDVNSLDNVFDDGGKARCDFFTIHADFYAVQFGDIASPKFNAAFERVLATALKKLNKETMRIWVARTLNASLYLDVLKAEDRANEKQWRKTAYSED